jgi:hypothetical protein
VIAILCCVASGAVAAADQAVTRLNAFADGQDVYVEFATAAPVVEGLDARFLELNPVAVEWEIDLRPAKFPNVFHWWDRAVKQSTLEIVVNPSTAPGTCKMHRQLNGRWLEPPQVVSCATANHTISSFDERVFTLIGLLPASFDVTIRATVVREQLVNVKTPILARSRLVQSNSPHR